VEVPLAEGLRRTWAWFAESNAGAGAREVGAGRAS
jgi:hypothetical protein